ncbi:hypothetical protein [Olivibacter jilunii]|uniref:hypothetical protein n=1 Tax=Olivibacter jilunii TaxID=985016 RepID=UPI003F134F2F
MRKVLLALVFFSISFPLCAQITRIDTLVYKPIHIPQKQGPRFSEFLYSVGLRAFAYEQFPKILDQTTREHFYSSAFNGLFFKFNDNQISYRIAGSYFDKDVSLNGNCINCSGNGNLKNTTIKIGFEKNITYTRLQPYFGLDLGYTYQKYKGSYMNGSDINVTNDAVIDRKDAILASPFIGLKFNIIPTVTIAAESNLTVAYSFQKIEIAHDETTEKRPTEKGWEYYFGPVGILSVQFNFGNLY